MELNSAAVRQSAIPEIKTEARTCQGCNNSFSIEPDDFIFYERKKVPPPTFCPECRFVRKMTWRNERQLYKRQCALCDRSILAMYSEEKPYTVYCRECWHSDQWDPNSYTAAYDWGKSFFAQWKELFDRMPQFNLWQIRPGANSEYTNYAMANKNCYLLFTADENENVNYSYGMDKNTEVFDSISTRTSTMCYENIDCDNNYNCKFMLQSQDCINCAFVFDSVNCQDCTLSSNLRNSRYVFENRQLSKEDYEAAVAGLRLDTYAGLERAKARFDAITRHGVHRFSDILNSQNCTGDLIENSKGVHYSFDVYDGENSKYCYRIWDTVKDCFDCMDVGGTEFTYESLAMDYQVGNAAFSMMSTSLRDCWYSVYCKNSSNLFGCIGLSNKQYCIFNTQYTKEEFETLVPKIIAHMNEIPYRDRIGREYRFGEFFPSELSPFAYNETLAQQEFPLTKEGAERKGFAWREGTGANYEIDVRPEDLPETVSDWDDSILAKTIGCAHGRECNHQCTYAFRLIPQELEFYRKMRLPIPHLCSNCRHYERLKKRNPVHLWTRHCMCNHGGTSYQNRYNHVHGNEPCRNEFTTTYDPGRKEAIYCEGCYNSEVVA